MRLSIRPWPCLLACVGALTFARPAETCGAFVAKTKQVPSLAVEQTLIIYDAQKELEHFVRQVAIRDPSPGFGFVVPVPSQPEVAKVPGNPFEKLVANFPVSSGLSLSDSLGGGAPSRAPGSGSAPVSVLSRARVGSFTAFVLAANDAAALEKWLRDNHFSVSPEARSWLDHYVKLDFFFAALRYEGAAQKHSDTTQAETLRISFHTPFPFYPYREPSHASGTTQAPRDLAVWLVTPKRYVPVALFESGGSTSWQRPLMEHYTRQVTLAEAKEGVGAALSPLLPTPESLKPGAAGVDAGSETGQLSVQVFEDQKRSRAGFGDIVMVPAEATPLGPGVQNRAKKLMASLDPHFEVTP